ncbi:hypothetical protein HF520_00885 [Romboutsia sp. CE17]|nr:hypothetical protein [Romboutsia sp. CE17]QJA07585.1 hypothetical protein HF520_00885 [Romboutsia sp. CE17]
MELYNTISDIWEISIIIFNGFIKIMTVYTIYLAMKSFKIYINKNS